MWQVFLPPPSDLSLPFFCSPHFQVYLFKTVNSRMYAFQQIGLGLYMLKLKFVESFAKVHFLHAMNNILTNTHTNTLCMQ